VPFATDTGELTRLWMPSDEADPEKLKRLHLGRRRRGSTGPPRSPRSSVYKSDRKRRPASARLGKDRSGHQPGCRKQCPPVPLPPPLRRPVGRAGSPPAPAARAFEPRGSRRPRIQYLESDHRPGTDAGRGRWRWPAGDLGGRHRIGGAGGGPGHVLEHASGYASRPEASLQAAAGQAIFGRSFSCEAGGAATADPVAGHQRDQRSLRQVHQPSVENMMCFVRV
jgi:hypothetical protein